MAVRSIARIGMVPYFSSALLGLFAKNSRRLSSSHLTSSLLSPGPVGNVSKESHACAPRLVGKLTTSPVTPDGWEHSQLTDPRPHVLDFDLGVFRSWNGCISTVQTDSSFKAKLTEVQIRLRRQHKCLRFDAFHRCFKVAIVRFLLGYVAALPGVQHCEHVLGI